MRLQQILIVVACVCFSACAGVHLKNVDPSDTLREFRQDIISSATLSPPTLQALRMAGLTQAEALEVGVSEEQRRRFESMAEPLDKVYIESELAIGRAQFLERTEPEKSVALYLVASGLAYHGFFLAQCGRPVDLRCDSFKVFYDRAVRGIVTYLSQRKWNADGLPEFATGAGHRFSLAIGRSPTLEDPREYKTILPSSSVGLEGLTNRHRRSGIGASLVACRPRRDDSPQEQYLPRVGVCLPLTAVISFPKGDCPGLNVCPAKLELLNSVTTETYNVSGAELPLAADFTAPLAALVEKTGMGGWDGLFDAIQGNEELLKNTGFYTTEPYNVGKIPLITVHGLFSNPLTWIDVHNDLMGDPVIRQNYQVWHYLYPTALPIIENAKTFREQLDQLQQYLVGQSPGKTYSRGLVVVSHSMGGILARTAVVKSSKPLKEFFFGDSKAIEQLDLEDQQQVSDYLDFSRKPYIDRVVFIAVPHRGSDIADNWIGRLGRSLLSLPKTVVQKSVALARKTRNLMRPDLRTEFDSGEPSSIQGLSAKNPVLVGISRLEIDSAVPYHSIIGDRGRGDTPSSSDGVVGYSSSHVEGAQSELIVPADHTAHASPLAVAEIRRVLRLHLDVTSKSQGSRTLRP